MKTWLKVFICSTIRATWSSPCNDSFLCIIIYINLGLAVALGLLYSAWFALCLQSTCLLAYYGCLQSPVWRDKTVVLKDISVYLMRAGSEPERVQSWITAGRRCRQKAAHHWSPLLVDLLATTCFDKVLLIGRNILKYRCLLFCIAEQRGW